MDRRRSCHGREAVPDPNDSGREIHSRPPLTAPASKPSTALLRPTQRVVRQTPQREGRRRCYLLNRRRVLADFVDVGYGNREEYRSGAERAGHRKRAGGGRRRSKEPEPPLRRGGGRNRRRRDAEQDRPVQSRVGCTHELHLEDARNGAGAAAARRECGEERRDDDLRAGAGHGRPPFILGKRLLAATAGRGAASGAPVALTHARKSPTSNEPLLLPR